MLLRLHAPSLSLWERFQRGDQPRAASTEDKSVLERWARAASYGVAANGPSHPVGVGEADLAVRRDRAQSVVAEGTELLQKLAHRFAERGLLALVADQDGIILFSRGGGDFLTAAAQVGISEGANWSEATRGTNAVGTALHEGVSVLVEGTAHFEKGNHGIFCVSSPIRDPFGRVIAVVDVSGKLADQDPSLSLATTSTALAIERIIRARKLRANRDRGTSGH